jgi:hypothetical protein
MQDRRRFPRLSIETPCKVYDRLTRRFAPARTVNVSAGGALLEVRPARPLEAGAAIDIAVSWSERPIIPASTMIGGRVVRGEPEPGGAVRIGVAFAAPIDLAEAA